MTVKDLQGVMMGKCEWRIYDRWGNYVNTYLTYAYDMRFKFGYANYKIRKMESGLRTDGLTTISIWPE